VFSDQDDVYSASFAAVPHIVRFLAASPTSVSATYFQFPAWVEICRRRRSVTVPEELASAYFGALDMLGGLVCAASSRDWDYEFLRIALSAMALSKGSALIAEVLQELDVLSAEEFLRTRR